MVDDLRLARGSKRNGVLVKDVKDILTDLGEFGLDALSVALGHRDLSLVALRLFLLLNR